MSNRQRFQIPQRYAPRMLEGVSEPVEVILEASTRERVAACHAFMLTCIEDKQKFYGTATGFGPLVAFPGRENLADQGNNVLDHLTAGQGRDLPPHVVRAALMVRLWSLSQGRSGVALATLDAVAAALGTTFAPAVPEIGSVGASGDLIPLAYMIRALRGQGHAYLGTERLPADEALRRAGLTPLALEGRDALAFVNGTSLTAAVAGLAMAKLNRAHRTAVTLSAVLADLLGSTTEFLTPALLGVFGHSNTVQVGDTMRAILADTIPSGTRPFQEPYSVRCTPQLLGAAKSALAYAETVIVDDLNGISDNPLFFPEDNLIAHGGNFFGQPVAFASDTLSIVATQIANLTERQLDLLVDPHRNSGRPPMLASDPGRQHGLQGVQLAATATVAAMRRAAMPASMQSLPTNGHNQDVVPFGTQAALNALSQANHLQWLQAALALALRQYVHVGQRQATAPAVVRIVDRLVELIPPIDPDRALDTEIHKIAALLDELAEQDTTA